MLLKLCLNTCLPSVHNLLLNLFAWSFRACATISDHYYITLLDLNTLPLFESYIAKKNLFLRYMHVDHRLKIPSPSTIRVLPCARTCKTTKRESCTKRPDGNLASHSTNCLQTSFSFTTTSLYNHEVQPQGPWS